MSGGNKIPAPQVVRLPVSDAGPINAHGPVAAKSSNVSQSSSSTGTILTDALKKMGFAGFLGR